jgi:hypothetical protein
VLAVVGLVVARRRVLSDWFGRDAIASVDPAREILKLAALAAEGNPGCLGELAAAKHTDARRHGYNYRSIDL